MAYRIDTHIEDLLYAAGSEGLTIHEVYEETKKFWEENWKEVSDILESKFEDGDCMRHCRFPHVNGGIGESRHYGPCDYKYSVKV